jgi:subtilisin family serine protease
MTSAHVPAATALYKTTEHEEISVLLEAYNDLGPVELKVLSGHGTVTTAVGPVAVLHTHKSELPNIARLPFLSRIQTSSPLKVYLDKSVPDIGADTVWNEVRDPNNRNVTGSGVIIGFVDTGIDPYHPDFTYANGSTKILYIWDQTTRGQAPSGFDYGNECTSADIDAKNCPEKDTFGHGTHVAGIATGSGRATGNYTGVAPDANIIFVKSGHEVCTGASWTFDSTQILDGINYIVKKAAALGKRLVINLSLGGNVGGHDGSDPWEKGLDEFVKSGVAIVVAAGNQALDRSHIRGQLNKDPVTFDIGVKQSSTSLYVDIWYSSGDDVEATLKTPSGKTYTIPTEAGEKSANYGNVTTFTGESELGNEVFFEIDSPRQLALEGWTVTLNPRQVRSSGVWDAWIDTAGCVFPGAVFLEGTGYQIDRNITIGIPATAHYVVTVGAYITKTTWTSINGENVGSTDVKTGTIASFSSLGPTRDGRIKPDIAAPGMYIASAKTSAIPKRTSDPDLFHTVLAGTSMAAPHVAGVVALMFQYAPTLPASSLAELLRRTAKLDPNTGLLTSGSPAWGFGKVDARTATGMYRVTLISNGTPAGAQVSVTLDATRRFNITSKAWVDLYFQLRSVHTISFGEVSRGAASEDYVLFNGFMRVPETAEATTYAVGQLTNGLRVNQTGYIVANYTSIVRPVTTPPESNFPLQAILAVVVGTVTIALGILVYLRRSLRRKKNERENA